MPLLPLVDGDILLYSVGYGTKGDFIQQVERTDEFLAWMKELFEEKPEIYLSGPTNFREGLATIKPYKGQRSGERPRYYQGLKEYLINFCGAIVSEWCEADDLIASRALDPRVAPNTVICSIDKDYLQLPVKIFNHRKNELREISEQEAWFNFYQQMITGDVIDNVPGLQGLGEVKSARLLEDKSRAEMEEIVKNLYCTHTIKNKETGERELQYENGLKAFEEVKSLLWLRRDILI